MSTPIQGGGPAFPQHGWSSSPDVLERMKNQGGMTLRDWFAGMALQGMISNKGIYWQTAYGGAGENLHGLTSGEAADLSFAYADAMLKAREEAL